MSMRYQPQGLLRIERGALGDALVASVVPSQYLSAGLSRPIAMSSGVSRVATSEGIAFQHSAANGNVGFGAPGGMSTLVAPGAPISVFLRIFVANIGVRQALLGDFDAGGINESFNIEITGGNQWRFATTDSSGRTVTSAAIVTPGWHDVLAVHRPGAGNQLYVDGVSVAANAAAGNLRAGSALRLGSFGLFTTLGFQGRTAVCHIFRGDVSAQYQSLRDNPWQVFEDPSADEDLFAETVTLPPADTSLAGAAIGQISATGALSTSVRLSGAAALAASASGALSTGIGLSGAAAVQASAAGTLTTAVRLAGTAAMRMSAAGTLAGAGAELSGAASAQILASGELSTSISLTGAASVRASASGSLAGAGAILTGATALQMSAAGVLSSAIRLAGAAVARMSAIGTLGSTRVPIELPDISKISPARIVIFEGGGSRVVPFGSSGSRVTPFGGTGSRITPFEGSGSRTVRFE